MNPEMAYFIRPCSLPQSPAFPPCKGRESRREFGSQAFDMARFSVTSASGEGSNPNFLPALRVRPGMFGQAARRR